MFDLLQGVSVILNANKTEADAGEVLVGLGNSQMPNEGIVLQHKTQETRYESLSSYVYQTEFEDNKQPIETIFVEDFSVDTVLSLWIFLQKVHNKTVPKQTMQWVEYATLWERGDTTNTGKPFASYGCLQNALMIAAADKMPTERLLLSLSFLENVIMQEIDPSKIPHMDDQYYNQAMQALQNEYEKYHQLVEQSRVKILSIPDTEGKRKKVSAIFIETKIISSVQKVFLRNDEQSPTGDGYGFMAVYNASAKGTGNDIVITVDPLKNLVLRDLWYGLEKEEEHLWKGKRPHAAPRPLVSYPDNNGPDQPWWDDMGKYTLIAAPKKVGNSYGRRVSWEKVKQLIDELYSKGEKL